MSEEIATYDTMSVPATNGDAPPAKRNGSRGLLPSTWIGRSVRLSYVDAHGMGVESSGTLLDWCPVGPIFNLRAGGRVLLSWDRLVMLELASD